MYCACSRIYRESIETVAKYSLGVFSPRNHVWVYRWEGKLQVIFERTVAGLPYRRWIHFVREQHRPYNNGTVSQKKRTHSYQSVRTLEFCWESTWETERIKTKWLLNLRTDLFPLMMLILITCEGRTKPDSTSLGMNSEKLWKTKANTM